jgi:hypothetical protein
LLLSRQHNHLGTELYTIVEVNDIIVGKANAAARHVFPDAGWIVRAVDAILRATDINGPGAERIARPGPPPSVAGRVGA